MLYLTSPMTWYLHYEPNDYYRFTKYGLKHLCENHGFEVLETERLGGFTFYFLARLGEFLHDYGKYLFVPLRIIPGTKGIPTKLTILALIPFQLWAIFNIFLFDRFSPRDARCWLVVAKAKTG